MSEVKTTPMQILRPIPTMIFLVATLREFSSHNPFAPEEYCNHTLPIPMADPQMAPAEDSPLWDGAGANSDNVHEPSPSNTSQHDP